MQHATKSDDSISLYCTENSLTYLAEVELSIFLGGNTFNLNERGVGAGVTLGALVTENTSLRVESTNARK